MTVSFLVDFTLLADGLVGVVGTRILETFVEGVIVGVIVLAMLMTSSDFFGVAKVEESCDEAMVFDGEIIALALIGLVPAAVCFRRGSVGLITSGVVTISCAVSFADEVLLLIAVSSCKFFAIACLRAFTRSFTSSSKRSDVCDDGVDTVDADELLLGDENCFGISAVCSETFADGVVDVTIFVSAVCALLMFALTDRGPAVAERGVCCD